MHFVTDSDSYTAADMDYCGAGYRSHDYNRCPEKYAGSYNRTHLSIAKRWLGEQEGRAMPFLCPL